MRRIAIVGFDSLDMGLIKRWAGAGDMPTFRRLLSNSYARSVRNPQGFEAGSVWPSFSTGFGPAEHGQFDGMQCFDRQAYQKRFLNPSELTRAPFWRRVADAGKRAAVIDVPYSFREERFNGIQIVDWLTHVTRPDGIATNPTGLASEIVAKYGDSPFDSRLGCPSNFADVSSAEAVRAFVDSLAARIERKRDCARDLYCAEDWPLFVVAFHDAHDVGHMCWHLHDETHELHDRSIADVVGDPIKEIYVALDRALDELLRTFDDQTTALIYCSHGIRAERTATGFLDEILTKLEGVYNARSPEEASSVPGRDLVGSAYRAIVPQQVRKWVRRTEVYGRIGQRARNADRMARSFFELAANHATGGVRINLAGREGNGVVAPGAAFDRLCERLINDLQELVNPDTGAPIVTSAALTSDLHNGPMRESLPDILLNWDMTAPILAATSPRLGTVQNPYERQRSGDHGREFGALFVTGQNARNQLDAPPLDVTALAPTIMRSLGLAGTDFADDPVEDLADALAGQPLPAT